MNFFQKEEICPGLELRALRIGPLRADRDSIALYFTHHIIYSVCISWPGWGIDNLIVGDTAHWHGPDGALYNMGPGKRLEFTIWPLGHWLIGIGKGHTFQKWTFKRGHRSGEDTRIRWTPPRRVTCKNLTGETEQSVCGAWRWHRCPYV